MKPLKTHTNTHTHTHTQLPEKEKWLLFNKKILTGRNTRKYRKDTEPLDHSFTYNENVMNNDPPYKGLRNSQ